MSNPLAIRHYPLNKLMAREDIVILCDEIINELSESHLSSILNAFHSNTVITKNGMLYIGINGASSILRTGSSGAARHMIYSGVEGIIGGSPVVDVDGEDFISGPCLSALIQYRISTTRGRQKEYLKYSKSVFDFLNSHSKVEKLQEMFVEKVDNDRCKMKNRRIDMYNITQCEFSGEKFDSRSDVEFAHIDSVSTAIHKALDVNNGVIILKTIHAKLTDLKVHDFSGMVEFCKSNSYSLDWAKDLYED